MWAIVLRGGESLKRNENCSYTVLDIPVSNCSNDGLYSKGEVRGSCTSDGFCLCNEGYTGKSDWINLDGLDCHFDKGIRSLNSSKDVNFALVSIVSSSWLIVVVFRVLWKTFATNREKQTTFKAFLVKKPCKVCLFALISTLPLLFLGLVKYISPETPMVDPQSNPLFFVFTYFCLNFEWWSYSTLISNILEPIASGIHTQSQRGNITFINDVLKISTKVPLTDGIFRSIFVSLALAAGQTKRDSLTLWLYAFGRLYSRVKYLLYVPLYIRTLHLAIIMLSKKKRPIQKPIKSGSTAEQKLNAFKCKLKALKVLLILSLLMLVYEGSIAIFKADKSSFGHFVVVFMPFRSLFAIAQGMIFEILYLDAIWNLLKFFKCLPKKQNPLATLKSEMSSGTETDDQSFECQNPMRESRAKANNLANSNRAHTK